MKRIVVTILTMFLVLTFFGCGSEKTQIEKAQDKIVQIGEQFLDYELTVDEAREKLESIIIPETEGNGKLFLSTDRDYLSFLILKTKTNSATFEEIQDKIDYIRGRDYGV